MSISRRQFVLRAGVIPLAAFVPTTLIVRQIQAAPPDSIRPLPTILSPRDSMFNESLDALFPGLRTQSTFQSVLPTSILLTNTGSEDAYGYLIKWSAPDGGSTYSYDRAFYLSSSSQLTKRQYSGQYPILAPGDTALVNPISFWTKSLYAAKYSKSGLSAHKLARASRKRPKAFGFCQRTSALALPVSASIGATIYETSIAGAVEAAKITEAIYINERNGEHDEAYVLLANSVGLDGKLNAALLLQNITSHKDKFVLVAERGKHKYYAIARASMANKVKNLINTGAPLTDVQTILKEIASLPKMAAG